MLAASHANDKPQHSSFQYFPARERDHASPPTLAAAMAFGHRGLAGLDVRWSGHAPLHAGGRAVRGPTAGRRHHHRPSRRPLRLAHSGRLHAGMGFGWRPFWTRRGSPRPRAGVELHGFDLRRLYGTIVLRPGLVASADL